MKKAYLIQCHKDPILVNTLIKKLSDSNTDLYIHVDSNSKISKELDISDNVYLLENRYKIRWGTVSQIYATIELLRSCVKREYDYISLISGQDFPIKSNIEFAEFLLKHKGKEFIEYFPLPNFNWKYEGGIGRVKFYWLDFLTPRKNFIVKIIRNLYLLSIGKLMSKDISLLGKLYGGSSWFTITGELAEYIVDFIDSNPNYINLYRNSGCADEIFFQTLIMNSPFRDNVENNNLRFIKWEEGNINPSILTISDKDNIDSSDKFIMRKVDTVISKELIS